MKNWNKDLHIKGLNLQRHPLYNQLISVRLMNNNIFNQLNLRLYFHLHIHLKSILNDG